jgi:hypothetical protein
VAGTAGWRGPLSPFKGEVNDGAVAVSETLVKDHDHPALVPSLHTFLMNSRLVHRLIVGKLAPMNAQAGPENSWACGSRNATGDG